MTESPWSSDDDDDDWTSDDTRDASTSSGDSDSDDLYGSAGNNYCILDNDPRFFLHATAPIDIPGARKERERAVRYPWAEPLPPIVFRAQQAIMSHERNPYADAMRERVGRTERLRLGELEEVAQAKEMEMLAEIEAADCVLAGARGKQIERTAYCQGLRKYFARLLHL